jgi:hypothetical protein
MTSLLLKTASLVVRCASTHFEHENVFYHKAAQATKAGKAARRPRRSTRVASEVKKLRCRYCGSDDLAPSFLKRRDARCRACFKRRYGSAVRDKTAKRTGRAEPAK